MMMASVISAATFTPTSKIDHVKSVSPRLTSTFSRRGRARWPVRNRMRSAMQRAFSRSDSEIRVTWGGSARPVDAAAKGGAAADRRGSLRVVVGPREPALRAAAREKRSKERIDQSLRGEFVGVQARGGRTCLLHQQHMPGAEAPREPRREAVRGDVPRARHVIG